MMFAVQSSLVGSALTALVTDKIVCAALVTADNLACVRARTVPHTFPSGTAGLRHELEFRLSRTAAGCAVQAWELGRKMSDILQSDAVTAPGHVVIEAEPVEAKVEVPFFGDPISITVSIAFLTVED